MLCLFPLPCAKSSQKNVREKDLYMQNLLDFSHATRQFLKYFMKQQKKKNL